ncbi:MAG: universal stress protein, partial [Acidobacteria bacterium]|nr:universal stress protein [Acidobacteriota bacterium]
NHFTVPPYFTPARMADFEQQLRESMGEAEDALRRFAVSALGELPPHVKLSVVESPPVDAIMAMARESGADLIAMGTHGRTGWNRFMAGSVAERVIRESRIPVLTVRGEIPPRVRSILCPVTGASAALKVARQLSACLGAGLTVLHVQESGMPQPVPPQGVKWVVRQGEAAGEILSESGQPGCDLVVMGTRHRAFFDSTVIGATTARVVRHASCPVLTVIEGETGEPSSAGA